MKMYYLNLEPFIIFRNNNLIHKHCTIYNITELYVKKLYNLNNLS